jgi:oxalate decarboxylase
LPPYRRHLQYTINGFINIPPPLPTVKAWIAAVVGKQPKPFVLSSLVSRQAASQTAGADSTNFVVSKGIAATRVAIKPGGVRAMHWHPNGDE